MKLTIGGKYNWKYQPERLVYVGKKRYGSVFWHQFDKVGEEGTVWCEVLEKDLENFEESVD